MIDAPDETAAWQRHRTRPPRALPGRPVMHISVTEESIAKASSLFWGQMLAMKLIPVEMPESRSARRRCIGPGHAMGSCALSGVWNGRIEVRLSQGLALEATSAMLMQPPEHVLEGDMLDATKEIANMIAGTLKSALPRPCAMSVPSAQIESEDFCVLPRTEDSVTVIFTHQAGELMVRVWESPTGERTADHTRATACGIRFELQAEPAIEALAPAF